MRALVFVKTKNMQKRRYIVPETVNESLRLGIEIMIGIGAGSVNKEPEEGDVKAWNDEFEIKDTKNENFDW